MGRVGGWRKPDKEGEAVSCVKKKGCKASIHYEACPEHHPRQNDDATYNRSTLSVEDAMKIGMWDLVPSERGDSMG